MIFSLASREDQGGIRLERKRFIMNAGRTTKQGQQISAGKDATTYLVVRTKCSKSRMLVQVPVNTWEAYNGWGGKSLYPFSSGGRQAIRPTGGRVGGRPALAGDHQNPIGNGRERGRVETVVHPKSETRK